jgi:general stress protein YciG
MNRKRGFACLSPERRAEISAMGGASKTRDPQTRSFSINNELAKIAGKKGGQISRKRPLTPAQ